MTYSQPSPLMESKLPKEPFPLLNQWLKEAHDAKIPLPLVASFASASLPDGKVSNRMVNVKELTANGDIVFYSDFGGSRKGHDVATNNQVALTFYWQQLNRSVRIEGAIQLMSKDESAPFFERRSRDFQVSVVLGEQSHPEQGGRPALEKRSKELLESDEKLENPEYWRGAHIVPSWIEFWQGSEDRISDRLAYTSAEGSGWTLERLTP